MSEYGNEARQVSFTMFMRELLGVAEFDRQYQALAKEHNDLVEGYRLAEGCIHSLEEEILQLKTALETTTAALETATKENRDAEQKYYESYRRLLEPPDPQAMFRTFNTGKWFKRYYVEDGMMYLQHNYEFYPHKIMAVPLYGLRLQDKWGWVPHLLQCEYYNTLPSRTFGGIYVPVGFEPFKMRVLFGERQGEVFVLSDPLHAKDVSLEIWTHDHADAELRKERGSLTVWLKEHNTRLDDYRATGRVFRVAVPFDEMLRQSVDDSELLRQRCYSEYLKHYFKE